MHGIKPLSISLTKKFSKRPFLLNI